MKKICSLIIVLALLFVLTGCEKQDNDNTEENNLNTSSSNTSESESTNQDVNYEQAANKQMANPENGETIAIIKVKDYGDIKVKFFEDVAPKAVENFVTHAQNGYYDGVTFHRVIDEFMIQGGDPTGTGRGGESIWGEGFGEELSLEIVPYRGSLCMASTGYGTNGIGSQFFITQANYSENMATMMRQGGYPEGLIEQYEKYGGYMSLYLQYTVFGQVFEGMDIVDKIAKVETYTTEDKQEDKPEDKPVNDVVIDTVEITTYNEE